MWNSWLFQITGSVKTREQMSLGVSISRGPMFGGCEPAGRPPPRLYSMGGYIIPRDICLNTAPVFRVNLSAHVNAATR